MVDQRALATSPVNSADLRRGRKRSELGNAASFVVDRGSGGDAELCHVVPWRACMRAVPWRGERACVSCRVVSCLDLTVVWLKGN